MGDEDGGPTAPAEFMAGLAEPGPRRLLEGAVVTALAAVRPLPVEPLLALPVHGRDLAAALTELVNAAAMATDTGSARGHQATGARCGRASTKTAPAAMDVPPFFVMTARR